MKFILEDQMDGVEEFQGERILFADDDRLCREAIKILLSEKGLAVDTVESGEEAVTRYLQSEEEEYTAIFLDVHMMELDGYHAAHQIRQSGRRDSREVGIYAVSADLMPRRMEQVRRAGMNGYIMKPINYRELFQVIHQEINK
ncbi:MAG: response regulator [Lachnospiraceae bacterium]|nr:response regulator [Lachnospiraceae bacterium]MBP3458545.1 response regulator [Lachnospiraceae bacterium]